MPNKIIFVALALLGGISFHAFGAIPQEKSIVASSENVESMIREMVQHDLSYYAQCTNHDDNFQLWLSGSQVVFSSFVMTPYYCDEETTEKIISFVHQQAKNFNIPIAWWVTPNTLPPTICELLKAQEFALAATWYAMICFLDQLPHYVGPEESSLVIKTLTTQDHIDSWARIVGPSFGFDDALTARYADAIKARDLDSSPNEHFGAFWHNELVATGSLFLRGDNAGIFNIATHESFRKRGIATRLTRAILQRALERGARYAVLLAVPEAVSMYQKIGFDTVFDVDIYCVHDS